MKANELMIGDWVRNKQGKNEQVTSLYDGYVCTETHEDSHDYHFEPIPLTPEILEKNGFEKCNEDTDGAIQYEFGSENLGVDIWTPGNTTELYLLGAWNKWPDCIESYNMVNEMPIHYVHELQHALRFCGIDKTIEL